jgi:hypothetical protein
MIKIKITGMNTLEMLNAYPIDLNILKNLTTERRLTQSISQTKKTIKVITKNLKIFLCLCIN